MLLDPARRFSTRGILESPDCQERQTIPRTCDSRIMTETMALFYKYKVTGSDRGLGETQMLPTRGLSSPQFQRQLEHQHRSSDI